MADDKQGASFPCVLCNKVFCSKIDLQSHFREHGNQASRLKNRAKYEPEKKVTGPIECDVCGEQFTVSTWAIQHKFRKHPDVHDKYHCPTCGMLFTIKALYDRHYASHKGDEKKQTEIRCETCSATFNNQSAKDYHVKTTHKRVMKLYQPVATAPPSKKIKVNNAGDVQSVYYCHICGCEYVVKFNLQKHLELSHTEEERSEVPTDLIRCTRCDALFYNRKAYENHNIGHKPDDLYVTDEQQRLRTISRIDQDFDYRRVLPLADKYVPSYRGASKKRRIMSNGNQVKLITEDDEEMSPPSDSDSSESSDEEEPLSRLRETSAAAANP